MTGILEVADGRFSLPPGHDEALIDEASLAFAAPFARFAAAVARPLPELVEAFRTGAGIPYADYGEDLCGGAGELHAAAVRAAARQRVAAVDPGRRRAPAGCRRPRGWPTWRAGPASSSIAIARAYPRVRVDGLDLGRGLDRAGAGEPGRERGGGPRLVRARRRGPPRLAGRYDLVTVFEALHDMSRPGVGAARRARPARRGRLRDRGRRARGGLVLGAGRRRRAALLRIQRAALPAGRGCRGRGRAR